ncbi:pilin [Patescibacteria group bacterium]|nr:pilin [Patescibacteria group bacterium]
MFSFLAVPLGADWSTSECIKDGVATLTCIPVLFNNVVNGALVLSAFLALFLVVWGGLKYINSRGDPKKAESARKTLSYAFLGIVLVFFSFLIVNFISIVSGVSCIQYGALGFNAKGFGACQ